MKKTIKKNLHQVVKIGLFILLSSCATRELTPNGLTIMTEGKYGDIVDASTQHREIYSGLYNILDVYATLIRPQLALALLDQNARLFLWDQTKFNDEKQKATENLSKQTEVFVSFYTPERKHDDLHRSKTLWKIFLDVDGRRIEGTATKMKLLTGEVMGLYPHHSRFATPYIIKFPIAATSIKDKSAKFTVTGPVGSVTLDFKPEESEQKSTSAK